MVFLGVIESLVIDCFLDKVWLVDLGMYVLWDLLCLEWVM